VHSSPRRSAGILIPAFSPHRKGDLGIGDTLALREWIDWAAAHQVGFIQLLPINENGADESPYSAISSVALDPIYLTCEVAEIPGLREAEIQHAREQLKVAQAAPLVMYRLVRGVKRSLLNLAWSRFPSCGKNLLDEFAEFQRAESEWLNDYCMFRYLMEYHGETLAWDQWPEACRSPQGARDFVENQRLADPTELTRKLDFFAFVQWLCFRQWLALRAHAENSGVKLMGDVPIGISWHSCDVFFDREEFNLDWCGGSPSDGPGETDGFIHQWGQNWGIPLYRWDHMQANNFSWWRKRIARLTRIFQMFRLDHILGFYRIYAFPWRPECNPEFVGLTHEQAAAVTGGRLPHWHLRPDDTMENKAANRDDGDARLRAIIEAAAGAEIIAEDLGMVPDYVRPHLVDLGIAGFKIPHWDCHDHPEAGNSFPENSFATYSTHDHDPVNGIWRNCLNVIQQHAENPNEHTAWSIGGASNTLRLLAEFAGIPMPAHGPWPPFTEGIRLRLIKALFASNSRYAALMVTELFSINHRFNEPGTYGANNWRFRLPWTVDEILDDPSYKAIGEKLIAIISITGRACLKWPPSANRKNA
jgi:4-alpha-glucanotransferase